MHVLFHIWGHVDVSGLLLDERQIAFNDTDAKSGKTMLLETVHAHLCEAC